MLVAAPMAPALSESASNIATSNQGECSNVGKYNYGGVLLASSTDTVLACGGTRIILRRLFIQSPQELQDSPIELIRSFDHHHMPSPSNDLDLGIFDPLG